MKNKYGMIPAQLNQFAIAQMSCTSFGLTAGLEAYSSGDVSNK
jgi:hypothetical protein